MAIAGHVEALNAATTGIDPDQLRMHLCWGNYESPHHHDVDLADIIDIVLTARPRGLALEAANPRHAHEWKVFEHTPLPDDKILIAGVIDTCTNYVEHPDLVAERIERYASIVGAERAALPPYELADGLMALALGAVMVTLDNDGTTRTIERIE
jgi:5-methyltetrahydropteroyltriglutamate--homocysteine methyltransferase